MSKYIIFSVICVLEFIVFRNWFSFSILTAGDLPYYHYSLFEKLNIIPYVWAYERNMGMGGYYAQFLWPYFILTIPFEFFIHILKIPWDLIVRSVLFYPFLLISFFSMFYTSWKLLRNFVLSSLSAFIYTTNTYILMVVGGGQLQVSLAYSLFPLVIFSFINIVNNIFTNKSIVSISKQTLCFSVLLSLQGMYDIRFIYVSLLTMFICCIVWTQLILKKTSFIPKIILFAFIIPSLLFIFLHAYWILPSLLHRPTQIDDFTSLPVSSKEAVLFFSFAKFENSISLLHPYWPENIFGKTYHMNPYFLLIPLLAFACLIFLHRKKDNIRRNVVSNYKLVPEALLAIALIGAFLGKGASDPFKEVYIWLYTYFPGFSFFRDSTKWYFLTAFSYSFLIPITVQYLSEYLKDNQYLQKYKIIKQLKFENILTLLIIGYIVFLLTPAFQGKLNGTFAYQKLPEEYNVLTKKLTRDKEFYRTLWVPSISRYAYTSSIHPPVSAKGLFSLYNDRQLVERLKKNDIREILQNSASRYVILPSDPLGELYVTDRRYDKNVYKKYLDLLDSLPYLKKESSIQGLIIYRILESSDHIWSTTQSTKISYISDNPTRYRVNIKNAHAGDTLVFSEGYDPGWKLSLSDTTINSQVYNNLFNSFTLPMIGNYNATLIYEPQKYITYGLILSMMTAIGIIGIWIYLNTKHIS